MADKKNDFLNIKKRKILGRKVKTLRKEGIIPSNVYGKKFSSQAVEVDIENFEKIYKKLGGTSIIKLKLDSKVIPAIIHKVQFDPVTDRPIHVDFLKVDLKQKITAEIPVELVGESQVEKQGLGTVVRYLDEIQVEALPGDLPKNFEVNISRLEEVEQVLHISDIAETGKKVKILSNLETVVIRVEPPKKVEETVEEAEKPEEEEEEGEGEEVDKKEGEGEEASKEETESVKEKGASKVSKEKI